MKKVVDEDKAIGRRLRLLRKQRGMTMEAVAGKLGVTHQQVYKYELGISTLRATTALRLAELLGVSVSFLLCAPQAAEPAGARLWEELAIEFVSLPSDDVRATAVSVLRALHKSTT